MQELRYNQFSQRNRKTISIYQKINKSQQRAKNTAKMSTFQSILSELIKTGVVISHYPQFNMFEVLDKNDNRLVGLYTQKSSTALAHQYNLPVNTYIRNRYYKYELKLKILWKN